MKKISLMILMTMVMTALNACSDSDNSKEECSASVPCPGALVCTGGKCVSPEPECSESNPCTGGLICTNGRCVSPEPECGISKLCTDGKICENGKCVDPEPECDESNPCTGSKICKNGKCVFPKIACSDSEPCADPENICRNGFCEDNICNAYLACPDGKVCLNEKCIDPPRTCSSDSQCDEGYACDNLKCVPKDSCSMTRTCPDKKICRNGKCLDEKPRTACDRETKCSESGATCVAGSCVKCSCGSDETCTADGKCIKTAESANKNIKAGDECVWEDFKPFCDNNRLFSCSKGTEEPTHTVKVSDCGAGICAASPTDGLGCYAPCPARDDFYGECLNDFNSMDGLSTGISFKTHCTPSLEGPLIWTFTEGYEVCSAGCYNGSCIREPADYGKLCTQTTFVDTCLGEWASWCTAEPNSTGFVTGESCEYGFANDAGKFHCAIDAEGYADCVTECTTENEVRNFCHKTLTDVTTSDTRRCLKDSNGKLGYFIEDRKKCANGCNPETGKCI